MSMTATIPTVSDIATLVENGSQRKPIEHKQNLDAADFQKLFLEQITHQDPLAPMEQKDMMAQLAQMMEMSRNNETNEILKEMQATDLARARADSGALLGKRIMADSSTVDLKDRDSEVNYILPGEGATKLQIEIKAGTTTVKSMAMTVSDAPELFTEGNHTIHWDGTDQKSQPVKDGAYNVVVRAFDPSGRRMEGVTTAVPGYVRSVGLSGNKVTYQVGNTPTNQPGDGPTVSVNPDKIYRIFPD